MHHGVLPTVDRHLVLFQRWLPEWLPTIGDTQPRPRGWEQPTTTRVRRRGTTPRRAVDDPVPPKLGPPRTGADTDRPTRRPAHRRDPARPGGPSPGGAGPSKPIVTRRVETVEEASQSEEDLRRGLTDGTVSFGCPGRGRATPTLPPTDPAAVSCPDGDHVSDEPGPAAIVLTPAAAGRATDMVMHSLSDPRR